MEEKQKSVELHIMTDTHQPAQNAIEKASIENGSVHSYLSAPCVVRGIKMLLHAHSHSVPRQ